MTTKERVLAQLERAKGSSISGSRMAEELGVSRNSVWKAVRALREEGYDIEGVSNGGYRLSSECSILSAASIARYITDENIHVEFHESIGSTNNRAKELAAAGAPHGTVVAADCQTAGRGRQGRPFHSPAGSGIYFSIILRPDFPTADVALVTSFAAVCTAQAIEEVLGLDVQIKWVNDIFIDSHKACGILTEASITPEDGSVDYVVVGIGINVAEPVGGWPAEIADVAYAPLGPGQADVDDRRARIAALTTQAIVEGCDSIPARPHLEDYRRRSLLNGRKVEVFRGRETFTATVLGINEDMTLQVRRADGTEEALASGEVHIPSSQL